MSGVVVKLDASPIRAVTPAVEQADLLFCPCDYRCDFEELVFANDENDGIKNDHSDFLFKKIATSDTIEIQIVKNGVVLHTVTDDSFGVYYNGFDVQPLYVGWVADWTLIFNEWSGGRYQIKTITNILGDTTEYLSRYFRLNTFDIFEANETVKIESFQNGNIENSEFDLTGLIAGGWMSSIRLSGKFGNMNPSLERDIFQDSSYRDVQNRDITVREYSLSCRFVPESIQNRIAISDVLANQVLLTSYDVLQELKYEKYPVTPESFTEAKFDGLGRVSFEILFSDRQKNIIKTNI